MEVRKVMQIAGSNAITSKSMQIRKLAVKKDFSWLIFLVFQRGYEAIMSVNLLFPVKIASHPWFVLYCNEESQP